MRVLKTVISALLCLSSAGLFAQNTVKGQVVDSESGEGEPFTTYSIFIKGSSDPVRMNITDENGRFSDSVKNKGTYVIRFVSLGRKDVEREFVADGTEVDLGLIPLEDDAEQLASAGVTALKPLVKMDVDKMTYKVEDDVDSKSMTMLDMLRKVPMVTVDAQDNITVNGSSSFKIYVDGKPNPMLSSSPSQILKVMPASAFKRIEVITNPGARYDAEGVGGVLNFITDTGSGTKAVQDGYNATLNFQTSTKGDLSGGAFVSGQKDKFSFSANASLMRQEMDGIGMEFTRKELDATGKVLSEMLSDGTVGQRAPGIRSGFNASYEIDSLRLLTATAGLMTFRNNELQSMSTTLSSPAYSLTYGNDVDATYRYDYYNAGLDYQRSFAGKPGRALTASYLFSSHPTVNDTYSSFDLATITDRHSDKEERMNEHTAQLDYTTPLREGETFSSGLKFISRDNYSDSRYYLKDGADWVFSREGSVEYRHLDNIAAAYGEYARSGEKWGWKAGLRYEHTFQKVDFISGTGEDFKLGYGNFIPSASIQYNIGMTSNIGLSYNLRISRPGISYLNPYVDRSNYTSISYGNTGLKAEKSHTVNLVYNFFSPVVVLNLTGRYNYAGNKISGYSFFDSDGVLNTTYGNIVRQQSVGLNAFINVNIGQKTRVYSNMETSYVHLVSDARSLSNSGVQFNSFTGLQQTFPWDLRLSLNLMYSTKNYSLDGWHGGIAGLMGGITKSFLDDRLTVGLHGMTGFSKGGAFEVTEFAKGLDYETGSKVSVPIARAGFSINFSFGTAKNVNVKKTNRSISNDDVLDQGGQGTNTGSSAMTGGGM